MCKAQITVLGTSEALSKYYFTSPKRCFSTRILFLFSCTIRCYIGVKIMLLFPQQPKNLLVSAWFRPSCHCDHFRIRGPFTDPGPPTFLTSCPAQLLHTEQGFGVGSMAAPPGHPPRIGLLHGAGEMGAATWLSSPQEQSSTCVSGWWDECYHAFAITTEFLSIC